MPIIAIAFARYCRDAWLRHSAIVDTPLIGLAYGYFEISHIDSFRHAAASARRFAFARLRHAFRRCFAALVCHARFRHFQLLQRLCQPALFHYGQPPRPLRQPLRRQPAIFDADEFARHYAAFAFHFASWLSHFR